MKARSLILGLTLFVVMVSMVYWVFGFSSSPRYKFETVTLSKMMQTPQVRISASVVEESLQPLFAKEDGFVTDVFVSIGSLVKKGDVLATLDLNKVDLEYAQKMKSLKFNIINAQSAERYFRKVSSLEKNGFYTEAEAMELKMKMANTAREALSLQESITRLESRTEGKIIRAPFDGIVADMNWQVGDKIASARQLLPGFSVKRSKPSYIAKLEIPEDVAAQIFPGAEIELSIPLNHKYIYGSVTSVSATLIEDSNKNRYIPGTAKILITQDTAQSLKNGMRLLGTIKASVVEHGVWIPRAAIDLKLPENMVSETMNYMQNDNGKLSRKVAAVGGINNSEISEFAKAMSPGFQASQNTLSPNESNIREIYLLTGSNKIIKAVVEDGPGDDRYTLVDIPELEGAQVIVGVEPISKLKELFFAR